MAFEQWDVALARFPFVERSRQKLRPVVIVSSETYNNSHDLAVALMITTALDGYWASDHRIQDLESAGLPHACVVRFKLATIAPFVLERRIGRFGPIDRALVSATLSAILPLESAG